MAWIMGRACQSGACANPCCAVTKQGFSNTSYTGSACARTGGTPLSTSNTCACPFQMSESGTGPDAPYLALWWYFDFPALSSAKAITIVWDSFAVVANAFSILAWDGTTCSIVHIVNCATGSGTATVNVPAGTTRVSVRIDGGCNSPTGTTDQWTYSISCP